jgi:hypothetical protein
MDLGDKAEGDALEAVINHFRLFSVERTTCFTDWGLGAVEVRHQFHDEGLEDPIKEVAELDAEEFVGSAKVTDSAFVPSEDGVSAAVSIAGNSSAGGEQVEEFNAGAQLDVEEVDIVCQVQFAFGIVLDCFAAEFSVAKERLYRLLCCSSQGPGASNVPRPEHENGEAGLLLVDVGRAIPNG